MNPVFTPGCTRTPGLRHLHVDGANPADLNAIINRAGELGYPSETLLVVGCTENHDRTDVVSAEGHHEINHPGDVISTTLVEPFNCEAINKLVRFILCFPGVTIELEHVVDHIGLDVEGGSLWYDPRRVEAIALDLQGINYTSPQFLPIEYHHALDLPDSVTPPELEGWMEDTLSAGIMVGTWYAFQRPGQLALRSNVFTGTEGIRERVEREHAAFRQLCERKRWDGFPIRTVAERVLGIWSSPKK